jgi:hypothetical protein
MRTAKAEGGMMASDDRVELVIEGLPEDDGRVRLSAFMSQLQSLSATLSLLDRESNEGRAGSVFQIAELSYKSPLRVALEPKQLSAQPYTGGAVVARLKHLADTLTSDESLIGFDADLLEDIRALARPVGRAVKSTTLIFDASVLDLTPRIATRLDAALAVADECEGSIEGKLEQINVHRGANTFHIYPDVGARKVTCHFPERLYDDAVAAVGRRVEVFGMLRYRMAAPFPHQIGVSGIETFPPESELPDWADLRGRAPDATGALSSEAFVRELRDAGE